MGIRYSCDYPDCGKIVEIRKGKGLANIPDGWQLYHPKFAVQSASFIVCSTDHAEGMRVLNCQNLDIGDLCVGSQEVYAAGNYIGGGRLVGLDAGPIMGDRGVIAPAWAPMDDEGQRYFAEHGHLYSRQTLDTIIKELNKTYVPGSPEQIVIEQLRQVDPETLSLKAAKDMITSLDRLDYTAILCSDFQLVLDTLQTLFYRHMGDRDLDDGIYFVANNICGLNFGENPLFAPAVIIARTIRSSIVSYRGGGTKSVPTRKRGSNNKRDDNR